MATIGGRRRTANSQFSRPGGSQWMLMDAAKRISRMRYHSNLPMPRVSGLFFPQVFAKSPLCRTLVVQLAVHSLVERNMALAVAASFACHCRLPPFHVTPCMSCIIARLVCIVKSWDVCHSGSTRCFEAAPVRLPSARGPRKPPGASARLTNCASGKVNTTRHSGRRADV